LKSAIKEASRLQRRYDRGDYDKTGLSTKDIGMVSRHRDACLKMTGRFTRLMSFAAFKSLGERGAIAISAGSIFDHDDPVDFGALSVEQLEQLDRILIQKFESGDTTSYKQSLYLIDESGEFGAIATPEDPARAEAINRQVVLS